MTEPPYRFTAVKMYDKVLLRWKTAIKELTGRISKTDDEQEKERLKTRLDYMRRLDMAVVVSDSVHFKAHVGRTCSPPSAQPEPHRK